jgi:hypothetical protein
MKKTNIIVTGRVPPPIGGVTVFLKYLYEAANTVDSVSLSEFTYLKLLSRKYDVLHINASSHLKRLIYVLLGKLFFKKVFFVKHGGTFNLDNVFVKLSLKFADGVFCLNKNVLSQLQKLNVNCMQHSTVFSENAKILREYYPKSLKNELTTSNTKILLYINNNKLIDGDEIYGGKFILSCMPILKDNFEMIVVDLSGEYKKDFIKYNNITYFDQPQDFKKLLSSIDIYIRPTSSDGMSVALLEAGLLNVKCLASDVVERPPFVKLYKFSDIKSFVDSLRALAESNEENTQDLTLSSVKDILEFMLINK